MSAVIVGKSPIIDAATVRELLSYDPLTGIFVWKPRPVMPGGRAAVINAWNGNFAGKRAGDMPKDGRSRITIGDRGYFAHRLAWLYVYGEWPSGIIDHINHDTRDNSIANLRVIDSHAENARNRKLFRNNTTGVHGVSWQSARRKWTATISDRAGRRKNLGSYESLDDAIAVRKAAEAAYGYHPNHGAG